MGNCNTNPRAFINSPWILSHGKILWIENEKHALAAGGTNCMVSGVCFIFFLC